MLGVERQLQQHEEGEMALKEEDVLAAIPKGVIFPWIGTTKPPKGWAICDGTNGTPDLRGKFLMGATAEVAVGTQGGRSTHTHKVSKDGGRDGNGFEVNGECGLGNADPQDHTPPFHAVNYIVKL